MNLLDLIQREAKSARSGLENVAREEREKVLKLFGLGKSKCEAEDKQRFFRGHLSTKTTQKVEKLVGEIHKDKSFIRNRMVWLLPPAHAATKPQAPIIRWILWKKTVFSGFLS